MEGNEKTQIKVKLHLLSSLGGQAQQRAVVLHNLADPVYASFQSNFGGRQKLFALLLLRNLPVETAEPNFLNSYTQ